MKLSKLDEKKVFRDILLVIGIIAGFIFIVSFSSYYVSNVLSRGYVCVIPIPIMILLLSSLGVFVGSLIYYLLSYKFFKEKQEYSKDVSLTLRFLDNDERKLVSLLVDCKGTISQPELVGKTGLNKVKVSRIIKKLIERQVVIKKKVGKINRIYFHEDLEKLFR